MLAVSVAADGQLHREYLTIVLIVVIRTAGDRDADFLGPGLGGVGDVLAFLEVGGAQSSGLLFGHLGAILRRLCMEADSAVGALRHDEDGIVVVAGRLQLAAVVDQVDNLAVGCEGDKLHGSGFDRRLFAHFNFSFLCR